MKQWVCVKKMKGAQNFRMSEHFYFGLVLCKAMMLAVLFKQVFIVCTIRASQIGYFETLQSQHFSKEKNLTVSTLFSTMYARMIWLFLFYSFVALISN